MDPRSLNKSGHGTGGEAILHLVAYPGHARWETYWIVFTVVGNMLDIVKMNEFP